MTPTIQMKGMHTLSQRLTGLSKAAVPASRKGLASAIGVVRKRARATLRAWGYKHIAAAMQYIVISTPGKSGTSLTGILGFGRKSSYRSSRGRRVAPSRIAHLIEAGRKPVRAKGGGLLRIALPGKRRVLKTDAAGVAARPFFRTAVLESAAEMVRAFGAGMRRQIEGRRG